MVELQVLNYVVQNRDASFIANNAIDDKFFTTYNKEFMFIKNHIEKYGVTPDMATFIDKFPDFVPAEVHETAEYLSSQLYEEYNMQLVLKSYKKVFESFKAKDYSGGLEEISSISKQLVSNIPIKPVDLITDTSRYDRFVEKSKNLDTYYVSTGFPELDEVLEGGWDRKNEIATIVARPGIGKCLAKGTEILMADGTLKKVEDVKVGDKVQSLNRINTVLALHNGKAKGYKIIPNKGEPFIVSENHTLTLLKLKEFWDKDKKIMTTNSQYELVDMMIEDYLKLNSHQKDNLTLYRPSIDYETKEQLIPPYILGLWLGDGTSCRVEITTMDKEIEEIWNKYGIDCGCKSVYNTNKASKVLTIALTDSKGKKNKCLNDFNYYSLFNNKHIPLEYLTGDKKQRLELLAGIIDTDGYVNKYKDTISITQKSLKLIKQIAQLARGLGLRVGKISTKHNKVYNTDYYNINISGNISEIPTVLERKKGHNKKTYFYSNTGFKVEPINEVEYYGFRCDGDERYLLWDNTITHNTWIMLKCAVAAAMKGLRVGIYSGEMDEDMIGYRMDTLIGNLPNASLSHGNISVQAEYKDYIDHLDKMVPGSILVLTPEMNRRKLATVSDLQAFIEKEKLDMLCIDQHSLMEDERKGRDPITIAANICKDIKRLQTLEHIPIVAVSQQNRGKDDEEDKELDVSRIAQTDRIGQDSSVVLFLQHSHTNDTLTITMAKVRNGPTGKKLKYAIDLNKGIFTYLPSDGDASPRNQEEIMHQQMEFDGYDASKEDLVEFTGEDIF